jgi:hypothetical protein
MYDKVTVRTRLTWRRIDRKTVKYEPLKNILRKVQIRAYGQNFLYLDRCENNCPAIKKNNIYHYFTFVLSFQRWLTLVSYSDCSWNINQKTSAFVLKIPWHKHRLIHLCQPCTSQNQFNEIKYITKYIKWDHSLWYKIKDTRFKFKPLHGVSIAVYAIVCHLFCIL